MNEKPTEHRLGELVELDLPEARGGKTKMKVILGSSCTQCDLTGLGHSTCQTVTCSSNSRSDGNSIVYQKVEE